MEGIVGREHELAAVEAFLASDDRPCVLAIAGEPGIGKTTLWQEGVALARSRDATVLVARPAESEVRLAFAGLADLLAPVPEELFSELPAPQRTGLAAALLRAPSPRPPERRAVAAGFLSLLRALASDAAVVVAIDDLQWLDAPSAGVVEFAARRLAGDPVRLLVSLRSREADRLVPALARELPFERLELGPLSVAGLHRVLAQALGRRFPRPTLVRIAAASGGNPLHALEIARALDEGGSWPGNTRIAVPDDLHALVKMRVRSLPKRSRDALLRAAALARPDTALVEPAALAAAEDAGLVRITSDGRIHFVHPLFASAVYGAAGPADRRRAHRALSRSVGDPEERARHLALAAEGPDEGVVRELTGAAEQAHMRGAPDAAAELTELALTLVPAESPAADELRLDLARYLVLAGDFERASVLLEELRRDLDAGDLLARTVLALAEIDYWRKGDPRGLALAEEALRAARTPLVQARCEIRIAEHAGTVDVPKAASAARRALALLDTLPGADPGLRSAALGALVRADLFLGEGFAAEAAERALALELESPPAGVDNRIAFKLGQWLRYVDDLDGARARLEQAEKTANEEGDESSVMNILLNRVALETWAGRWAEAAALTARMTEAFEQLGVDPADVPWTIYVQAHAGRLDVVRAAAERARSGGPIWNRCLGLAELATGEVSAADEHLAQAVAELERTGFHEPAVWRVEGDAIAAAIAVGDLHRAELLTSRFERRAARTRIPWSLAVSARCRGQLLAARGELDAAFDVLERAIVEHERCPVPFERARTLLVHGQVQRRLKRKREARASLEEAHRSFERLGAGAWAGQASAELRRVTVRRAPTELSPTELTIARLAAEGLSNPEIATQAFVSRKTVEANLARAYRKLGISSRAQLYRALGRDKQIIS